jgi:ribosome recycling factor
MSVADVKKNSDQRMQKSIETLKADLSKVRTGRAHTGILDHVMVDYYGSPTNITQVANVTLIDAHDRCSALGKENAEHDRKSDS